MNAATLCAQTAPSWYRMPYQTCVWDLMLSLGISGKKWSTYKEHALCLSDFAIWCLGVPIMKKPYYWPFRGVRGVSSHQIERDANSWYRKKKLPLKEQMLSFTWTINRPQHFWEHNTTRYVSTLKTCLSICARKLNKHKLMRSPEIFIIGLAKQSLIRVHRVHTRFNIDVQLAKYIGHQKKENPPKCPHRNVPLLWTRTWVLGPRVPVPEQAHQNCDKTVPCWHGEGFTKNWYAAARLPR